MFNIYFWRRLHCLNNMKSWHRWEDGDKHIDAGYCLDRYFLEKE